MKKLFYTMAAVALTVVLQAQAAPAKSAPAHEEKVQVPSAAAAQHEAQATDAVTPASDASVKAPGQGTREKVPGAEVSKDKKSAPAESVKPVQKTPAPAKAVRTGDSAPKPARE